MPLVARLVTDELGRAVAVDAHPKHAIALGAAMAASEGKPVALTGTATDATGDVMDASAPTAEVPAEVASTSTPTTDVAVVTSPRSRRKLALAGAVGLVAAVGVVLLGTAGGGTDTPSADAGSGAGPAEVSATDGDEATAAERTADGAPTVVFEHVERDEVNGVRVRFEIVGTPPPGTPMPLHADFFYDDQHPESIGIDIWDRYARYPGMYYKGDPPAFLMPEINGLGVEFTQLCALVADADDRVEDPSTMSCVEVPDR
jgi:hypothetical protein